MTRGSGLDTRRLRTLLAARGVRLLDQADARSVRVECRQCRARWSIAPQRLLEPPDESTYWWCPSGCNHEQ